MPTDRLNTNNGRPLKPTLASTRTAKTPLTPRLATSASSTLSSRTVRSNVSTTPRPPNTTAQDDTTPVKPFLDSNITPRSSARKSRVGVSSAGSTPSTTPSVTPSNSRPTSTTDILLKEQANGYVGLGYNGSHNPHNGGRPRSIVGGSNPNLTPTPRLPLANLHNYGQAETGGAREGSSMFFHANDAKVKETTAPGKKAPVFFYAKGGQDDVVPTPPLSSVGRPASGSKFFHVDSLSEAKSTPASLTPLPVSASPEPWTDSDSTQRAQTLRPPSPPKENIHLSYRKGASQIMRPNLHSRPSALSVISGHSHTTDAENLPLSRRSSVTSAARFGHGKSASLSSIDSATSLKKTHSNDVPLIVPSPLHHEKRVISSGSLPESVASTTSLPTEQILGLASPSIQNPAVADSGKTPLERMNELAAGARRERKVLDLEISNSSLLAINRQLEKEVRKQKAELRRFRRMTRAGRFSTDTATTNLEGFSAVAISESANLSDMSDEEGEPAEDNTEYSSESSFDEGASSPAALAERDSAHRLKDEKRLQIDLSKHHELLVDSQKMNQSLKRCINWTEELIKDAQKALAYQVRASDVKLGGRVLTSEERHEEEDDDAESRALLSPWTPSHRDSDPLDESSFFESERMDRDSGVHINGLKPTTSDLPHDLSDLGPPLIVTPSRDNERPAAAREVSFRPKLPGQWESYTTTVPELSTYTESDQDDVEADARTPDPPHTAEGLEETY